MRKLMQSVEPAREVRNKNINCFEKAQLILSCLLILFGLLIMITGSGFINADIWRSGEGHMDGVEKLILTWLILLMLDTWLFSGFAICISRRRQCSTPCIAIFGALLFFLVMIPLFVQGTNFNKLGSIGDDEIDQYCQKNTHHIGNQMVGSFFRLAHNFDHMSSEMLDQYMCTDTCPCLDYGDNPSTKQIFQKDEKKLARHNRTFDAKDESKVFMNFTEDEKVGFRNFDDCYDKWYERSMQDANIDIDKVFVVKEMTTSELMRRGKRGRGGRGDRDNNDEDEGRRGHGFDSEDDVIHHYGNREHPQWSGRKGGRGGRMRGGPASPKYMWSHMSQIEMYQEIEDAYMCSGMCKKSLFHFRADLHYGIPAKTCIMDFRDFVHDHASGFATVSILAGVISLFLFLVHFSMYCRPVEGDSWGGEHQAHELPGASNLDMEMPAYAGDQSQARIPNDAGRNKQYEI